MSVSQSFRDWPTSSSWGSVGGNKSRNAANKEWFWFVSPASTVGLAMSRTADMLMLRLQHRVKLSTQYCGITIQTLITHVYVRPCQARTPGQCSPVSVSAVRKVRLPLDVYILQTEGRMEGERERDGWGGGMTYSCSAPTQSPPRLSASGHGHNILWLNIAV